MRRGGAILNRRGSILILVLWVVTLMALLSLSVGAMVRQYLRAVTQLDTRDKLRLVADSGIKKAIAVINHKSKRAPLYDSLKDLWSRDELDFKEIPAGGGHFSVMHEGGYGVVDEDRKIHLNRMNSSMILTRLFQYGAGLSKEEAYGIAASILDWKDEDDHRYDAGAETDYYESLTYPYKAKNASFGTLEELALVKGITPEILEKVMPDLTLVGSGRVNINTASVIVLKAVGFGDVITQKIMRFRLGRDGKTGTADDGVFTDLEGVAGQLQASQGLSDEEMAGLADFIRSGNFSISSENFLIRSLAQFPQRNEWLEIACVYRRWGDIIERRERFGAGPLPVQPVES